MTDPRFEAPTPDLNGGDPDEDATEPTEPTEAEAAEGVTDEPEPEKEPD